ncbi:MAG: HEAT repeat domain-containing protein [Thermoguttaceae bacterium]
MFNTSQSKPFPVRATNTLSLFAACIVVLLGLRSGQVYSQEPDLTLAGGVEIQKGGGVRGVVKNPDAESAGSYDIEPTLGGKLVVDVSETKTPTVLRPEQIDYRKFAPLEKDDVASQLKIARWAVAQKLSAIADAHFQRVVELDPENDEARKALQHVKVNGVWVSNKERMEQTGLVRVSGRSVSSQEAELIRQEEENKEAARYWKKEIQFLYQEALIGNLRAREAFRSIRTPQALAPILNTFEKEKRNPEGRVLLVQALSAIGTPAALSELGKIAITDPDGDVRAAAVDGICRKKIATPDAIEYFRRRLRNASDVASINRAAYALGRLQGVNAIPDLINALVTTHKRQVTIGSSQTGMSVDSTGKISGFSPGGGTRTQTITQVSENEMVHRALVSIVAANYATPVDFGYDVESWIRWRREAEQLANFYPRRDR